VRGISESLFRFFLSNVHTKAAIADPIVSDAMIAASFAKYATS
jgi:hypothetical protein